MTSWRLVILLGITLAAGAVIGARPQEDDPYDVKFMKTALQYQSTGLTVSVVQKNLVRLGDRVSIALLKTLDDKGLREPANVREYLPMICAAFSQPDFISRESDRRPGVTLVLLSYLEAKSDDKKLRHDIHQTIACVVRRTGEN